MFRSLRSVFVAAAFATVAFGQTNVDERTSTLSVCAALRNLKHLDGHIVSIQGTFLWSHRHGGSLSEPGLEGAPCPKMPRKARIWWSAIKVDSPLNPNLDGGPATFNSDAISYGDLIRMSDEQSRGQTVRLIVTFIGEIRTKPRLVIVPAPYGRGDVMGNGYGEGGAYAAMLVVKTFRNVRKIEDVQQ
jgi:hypothetical protein